MAARVERVDQLTRLGELHEALLEVGERPLHQAPVLLVVVQQVVPERLLGQHLGIAHHDDRIFGARERHIEAPGIGEEADALVLVGADAGDDDDVLLAALESVHARHLDVLVHLGVEGALKSWRYGRYADKEHYLH